jgi:hypothetical protein
MSKSRKITASELKDMVLSEAKKALKEKVKEVDAAKLADTLEKKVDHYAQLKLKEAKYVKALKMIREKKAMLKKQIVNKK